MTKSKCTRPYDIELTNEDWRKTCSTEEFAEWIAERIDTPCDICNYNCRSKCMANDKQVWLEWLKQPHREENEK